MSNKYPVIAIDGPAGSGKSTVSRRVADAIGAALLDTGALYRCVALRASRTRVSWDDEAELAKLASKLEIRFQRVGEQNRVQMDGEDVSSAIRTAEMSTGASRVSRHPMLRAALLELQRGFAERGPVVAEGRDVTTVVFPDATLKIYLDANLQERALRRHRQLIEAGEASDLQQVLESEHARDEADSSRAVAPLQVADDATVIDTTKMSIDEVVAHIVSLV